MLPLHSKDRYKPRWKIIEIISGWLRLIFADQNARNLFMFLLLNLSMAFVELFYGVWTNSLGLISDSFHMFFDCTALLAGLVASLISKWRANDKFSYGYVRAEIIAGFINGLFLIFIAFFIASEAVERLVEPPEVKHERLFLVSVAGFLVNIVGIVVFQHGGGHHGHSHGGGHHGHSHGGDSSHSHAHSHNNLQTNAHSFDSSSSSAVSKPQQSIEGSQSQIMQGVFLHILADTLGSLGVIISAGLIKYFGWMVADPICSLFIAILIGFSVVPLLRESVGVLMQRQPPSLDNQLSGCYQRVSQLDGVYSVQEPHFWTLCSDVYIGALKIEASPQADHKYILSHTHNIFTAVGVKQLYVQIDYAAS